VPIIEKTITCPGGLPAFVAVPKSPERAPVIVLLHERYGLVEHTRDLARRHAREGYVCIAADYFYKHPDQAALHAGDVSCDMTDVEALAFMEDSIAALADTPQADLTRIAAMGVCQTGRHPLVLAAHRPLKAALCWYGAAQPREWQENARYPVALDKLIANVDCPVLGMFGEGDHIISVDDVRKLRGVLEANAKSYHIEIFSGAPHGWLNDTMPGRYRRAQAEAAWAAQSAFLAKAFSEEGFGPEIQQSFRAALSPSYDFSKNVRHE
jgi:carboxymethylenebutenolidase